MKTFKFHSNPVVNLLAYLFVFPLLIVMGGVLTANAEVDTKLSVLKAYPVEDNKHIFKGALVCVNSSGYLQPATDAAAVVFVGVAYEECDNTLAGHTQGGKSCRVEAGGKLFLLAATGMAQTSVGQMVYVASDAAVALSSSFSMPVGVVVEYVSSTAVWVEIKDNITYAATVFNPFAAIVTKTDNYSVQAADSGTCFGIATDAKVFALPATVLGLIYTFINTGADGGVLLSVSPNAADKIMGGGLAADDDDDALNTKATAKKFDFITIVGDGVDGWIVINKQGIWATEA